MNIVMINISHRPWMYKPCYPIGLSYVVSAMRRAGYDFDIIDIDAHRPTDQELRRLLSQKTYDVIALGALVSGYKYAKQAATIARETNPDGIIIAGNSVASSIPEHLLTHTEVDVIVKGEGDLTMVNILRALEKGKSIRNLREVKGVVFLDNGTFVDTGYEKPIRDISEIPLPDWRLFDMELYLATYVQEVAEPYPIPKDRITAFTINTARGCPFRCTFCYHVFHYSSYRYRSAESIVAEIAELNARYGVNYINFYDECSFVGKSQIRAFLGELRKSGLQLYWNAIIRGDLFTEEDIDLLIDLRDAGCLSFGYSLESADAEILRSMNKKMTVEDFVIQKRALDKAGIMTYTSLVVGYPEETLETLKKTFDICYDLNIYPSTGYLLPQPGTPMFEVAKAKGLVNDMESYLMQMGDRQDLRFNLSRIPDDVLQAAVAGHLQKISDKLGLDLKREELVKTFSHVLSRSDAETGKTRSGPQ